MSNSRSGKQFLIFNLMRSGPLSFKLSETYTLNQSYNKILERDLLSPARSMTAIGLSGRSKRQILNS